MADFCQLWLTCGSKEEADKVTGALLAKHLVACVRQIPVVSDYHWEGKITHEGEILLVMESRLDLFDEIETEVTKHHSYGTFVLEALPVSRISKKAAKWLAKETKRGKT